MLVSAVVTTVGGLVIAFCASWRLTLAMMAFIPIVLIATALINCFLGGNHSDKATTRYAEVCTCYVHVFFHVYAYLRRLNELVYNPVEHFNSLYYMVN